MAYKITDSCVACGTCIGECPVEAISAGDIYVIDADQVHRLRHLRRRLPERSNRIGVTPGTITGKCGPPLTDRIFHSHNRYTLPT